MKLRLGLATLALAALATVIVASASSSSTVPVSMTLVEPLKAGWPGQDPCPDIGIDVNCGSAEVTPFGRARAIVSINGCGDNCTLRWIYLPQGTLVLVETASDFA